MADEVCALDCQRGQCRFDRIGQGGGVACTDILGRAAMARQVQRDGAPALRQRRLGEHPTVEVGAEAVQQQHRHAVAGAEFQVAQAPAAGFQLARGRGFDGGRFIAGRFGDDEAGDESVDLRGRRVGGRDDREQAADRQGGAFRRDDAEQRAGRLRLRRRW